MKRDRIEECLKGKPQAVYGLVDEYRSLVSPLVFAVEGQSPLTDAGGIPHRMVDLSSAAFIRILKGLSDAPGGPRFRSWARNRVFTELRGQTRLPSDPLDAHDGTHRAPISEAVESETVREAVSRLPGDQRLVVWALVSESMDVPQASELMGVPGERIMQMLAASLAEMRQYVYGGGEGGTAVEDEPRLRKLVYDRVNDTERRQIEGSTTRFSSVQRRLDDLIKERQALKRALHIDIPTSRILRELRTKFRITRFAIPPAVWLVAQVVIVIAFAIVMASIGREIPPANVGVEVVRGSITSSTGVVPRPAEPSQVGDDGSLVAYPSEVAAADPAGMHTLEVGETLTVAPYSSAVLHVEGPNDLHLAPGTVVKLEAATIETPIVISIERGSVWFDLRAFNEPVRLALPTGQHVRIARAEGLIDVLDGSAVVIALEGRLDLTAADLPGEVTHSLRSGQAGRFRLDGDQVVGPAPVAGLSPTGFPLPNFTNASDQALAVSAEYVRRLRLQGGTLKTGFHWFSRADYPLAFDRVPPAVQSRLDEFYANIADVRREGDDLAHGVEIATLRLQEALRSIADTERKIHLLELEIEAMTARSVELQGLYGQAENQEQAIARRIRTDAASPEPLYDPDGFRTFTLQAELTAQAERLKALRDLSISKLAAETALQQLQPQFQAAKTARAEAGHALERVQAELDRITAEIQGLGDLDATGADLALQKRNIEASIAALTARQTEATAAVEAARKTVAELESASARAQELQAAVTAAAAALEAAQAKLAAASEAHREAEAIAALAQERVTAATAARDAAAEASRAAAAHATEMLAKLQQAEAENESASNELSRLGEAVEAADAALAAARATLAERDATLRDAVAARDAAAASAEQARQQLAAATAAKERNDKQLAEHRSAITQLDARLAANGPKRDALTAQLQTLTARQREAQEARDRADQTVAKLTETVAKATAALEEAKTVAAQAAAAHAAAVEKMKATTRTLAAAREAKAAADARLAELEASSATDAFHFVQLALARAEVQRAADRVEEVQEEIEQLGTDLGALNHARISAADALPHREADVKVAQDQLTAARNALAAAEAAAEAATADRSRASQELTAVQAAIDADTAERERRRAAIAPLEAAATKLAADLARATASARTTASAYEQAKARADEAQKAHHTAAAAVEAKTAEQARAVAALEDARKRHGPASQSLTEAREKHDAARRAADEARQAAEAAEAQRQQAIAAAEAAAANVAKAEEAVSAAQRTVNDAATRHQQAQAAASGVDATIPQRLAAAREDAAAKEQASARLTATLAAERSKLARIEREQGRHAQQVERHGVLTAELAEAKTRQAAATEAVNVAQKELDRVTGIVEPKKARVAELAAKLAAVPGIEAARGAATRRIDEIRSFMAGISNMRSDLHHLRYRISRMEEQAGQSATDARRAELGAVRQLLADQQASHARLTQALDDARAAVEDFQRSGQSQKLVEFRAALVEELLGMIGGYRGLPITTRDAREVLAGAVRLYPLWRERVGPRMDDRAAVDTVERQWDSFIARWINSRMPHHVTPLASLTADCLLPPGQGLGSGGGGTDNQPQDEGGPDDD